VLTCGFVLLGVLWGGYLGAAQIAGRDPGVDRFENLTADWRFVLTGPRPAPSNVVIAAIDDETIAQAGGYPLSRSLLARIILAIAAQNPRAIAVDLLFLDAGEPAADRDLSDALMAAPSVIGAVGLFDGEPPPAGAAMPRPGDDMALAPAPSRILWPIGLIQGAARTGLVNVVTDRSGVPRHLPMIFRFGERVVPSFALSAAALGPAVQPVFEAGSIRLGAAVIPTDLGYHLPIGYYGPGGSIRHFSAGRVLSGGVDKTELAGQVVVLGVTAVGMGDIFATPFDRVVPGVEILATAIGNLVNGDGLVRTPTIRMVDATVAAMLPCLVVLLLSVRRPMTGIACAVLVFAAWLTMTMVAFRLGYWLSVAIPLAALVPVAAGYGAARMVLDRYVTRRLAGDAAALTRFQSPRLVEHILKHPGFLDTPARQDVGVVFLDLSGFTGVAEALGPEWTRDLLARYHTLIDREAGENSGFVVSFMGDGAMIVFGLPAPGPDDASHAVRTIVRLRQSINGWLQTLPPIAASGLGVRIAGHFGPAVVSRLGPADYQHIAATGDTVNVASRLLEVAKQRNASVVISSDLAAAGEPASAHVSTMEVEIRGRAQPISVQLWH